jgi:septum formation protein
LLERLALPFECHAPGVDEDLYKGEGQGAQELVQRLAIAKAQAVAERCPDAVIIGSDQCAEFEGQLLGKPHSRERAIAQLGAMAGKTHTLWTGVAVLDATTGTVVVDLDRHDLQMRNLTQEQIAAYVDRDEPFDCAGSYKIEESGIALFESVRGEDFTAIVGLPLTVVSRRLAEFGVDVFAP